jgi:hypothetical protein
MVFPDSTPHLEAPSKGPAPHGAGPLGAFGSRALVPLCLLALAMAAGEAAERGGRGSLLEREFGARPDAREPSGVLDVERSVHLEGVMPAELLAAGAARAIAAGAYAPEVAASAFELDAHVVRSVPAVWRMRLDDAQAVAELDVRCEIVAEGGQSNVLTNPDDPASVIHVWARPLAPQVLSGAVEGALVEGGVLLDLDLRGVRTAGPHTGTLTVTVERY